MPPRKKVEEQVHPVPEVLPEPVPEVQNVLEQQDQPEVYTVPPLSDEEILELRWVIFGQCPICHRYIRGWTPGAFHAERYKYWHDHGIDAVSGHLMTCNEKWRRQ
jgi:hypothetical protein